MHTESLFTPAEVPLAVPFAGADYNETRDRARLTTQVACVYDVTRDEQWRTLQQITALCRKRYPGVDFPEPSVSAQLRNLKKIGFQLEKRNVAVSGYLCQYRILQPVNPGVGAAAREAVVGR
jgi:hypothetical protein